MNGWTCVRCGCGFHLSWGTDKQQRPCAAHSCADYRPVFAWTPETIEAQRIAEAVHALRSGKPPALALAILEAA